MVVCVQCREGYTPDEPTTPLASLLQPHRYSPVPPGHNPTVTTTPRKHEPFDYLTNGTFDYPQLLVISLLLFVPYKGPIHNNPGRYELSPVTEPYTNDEGDLTLHTSREVLVKLLDKINHMRPSDEQMAFAPANDHMNILKKIIATHLTELIESKGLVPCDGTTDVDAHYVQLFLSVLTAMKSMQELYEKRLLHNEAKLTDENKAMADGANIIVSRIIYQLTQAFMPITVQVSTSMDEKVAYGARVVKGAATIAGGLVFSSLGLLGIQTFRLSKQTAKLLEYENVKMLPVSQSVHPLTGPHTEAAAPVVSDALEHLEGRFNSALESLKGLAEELTGKAVRAANENKKQEMALFHQRDSAVYINVFTLFLQRRSNSPTIQRSEWMKDAARVWKEDLGQRWDLQRFCIAHTHDMLNATDDADYVRTILHFLSASNRDQFRHVGLVPRFNGDEIFSRHVVESVASPLLINIFRPFIAFLRTQGQAGIKSLEKDITLSQPDYEFLKQWGPYWGEILGAASDTLYEMLDQTVIKPLVRGVPAMMALTALIGQQAVTTFQQPGFTGFTGGFNRR